MYMESWIQLYRFWNPVLPVQLSDSVLSGISSYRPSKKYEYQYQLFSDFGASLVVAVVRFFIMNLNMTPLKTSSC